jgi:hypothetical protein
MLRVDDRRQSKEMTQEFHLGFRADMGTLNRRFNTNRDNPIMTATPPSAEPQPTAAKSRLRLNHLLLVGIAAVGLYGAAEYGTRVLLRETKVFLDEVLIRESARNRTVFTYDRVEREGLLKVRVVQPRFVALTEDNKPVRFQTAEVNVTPNGWRSAQLTLPREIEVQSEQGQLLLLGNAPLKASVSTHLIEGLPQNVAVYFPERTLVRVLDEQLKRVGSYEAKGKNMQFSIEREEGHFGAVKLSGKKIAIGEEAAGYPVARVKELELSGSLRTLGERSLYDIAHVVKATGTEIHIPEDQGVPAGTFSTEIDLGWKADARVELFLHVAENPKDADTGMRYVVQDLKLYDGHLNIASLPLAKFHGTLQATADEPEPTGEVKLTIGGIDSIKSILKLAGTGGGYETYLHILTAVEAEMEKLGKRLNKDAIELTFTRKKNEAIMVGAVDAQQAMTQVIEAAMRGTGVNVYMEAPGIGAAGFGTPENKDQVLPHSSITGDHSAFAPAEE